MKKELPKVFHQEITKPLHNNEKVFYSSGNREVKEEKNVYQLFETNHIYRTKVKLTLKDKEVEKIVIGRTENNLITFDNEIIAINDIQRIELL